MRNHRYRYIWCVRLWLLILFLNPLSTFLISQEGLTINRDTTIVIESNRTFDESEIEEYRKKHNYTKDPENENNPISKLFLRFLRSLESSLGSEAANSILNIIVYSIMAIGVIALVYFLAKTQYGGIISQNEEFDNLESTLISTSSSEEEIDQLIQSAEGEGRFRDAIRFRYIKSLKKLTENGHINWNPEMTNSKILSLINNPGTKAAFLPCIKIYEYIWYGEYPVRDKSDYESMVTSFRAFHNEIDMG